MAKDTDKPELKLLDKEILDNLTAEEAAILKEKFGIDLEASSNLKGAKKHYDVTRERIREIEEKALRMLRKHNDDDPDAA